MRYAATEKQEIIRTVEESSLGMTRTLRQLDLPKSTFYHWYDLYLTGGIEGLEDKKPTPHTRWVQSAGGCSSRPGRNGTGSVGTFSPGTGGPIHG